MTDKRRAQLQFAVRAVIGPWGIHPIAVSAILLVFFNFSRTDESWYEEASAGKGLQLILANAPTSILSSILVWIPLALSLSLLRLRGKELPSLPWYWITIVVSAFPVVLFRLWTEGYLSSFDDIQWFLVLRTWFRHFIGFAMVSNIVGLMFASLRTQVSLVESANTTIENQQRLILTAEEQTRRSIADFLHDNVQASLVVIAMQLKELQSQLVDTQANKVGSLLESIETVRKKDVRSASRRLSPELAVTGFTTSLEDLAATYAPAMNVSLHCHPSVEEQLTFSEHQETALGLYRIIEQCLLNAATHGNATLCVIDIKMNAAGEIHLCFTDNGGGLSPVPGAPGRGTAVINGWVSILNGTWKRISPQGGGVVVDVWCAPLTF